MKNKFLSVVLCIILVAAFIGVFFVTSILDLTNTKDVQTATIDRVEPLMVLNHSINGIIPTGKDYYYVGIDESQGKIYALHVEKNWRADYFDSTGAAIGNGVSVKGLSKRPNDFEAEQGIAQKISMIANAEAGNGYVLALEPYKVIETNYVKDSLLKIIAGMLLLLVGVFMSIIKKRDIDLPAGVIRALIVPFLIILFFALWTII